MLISQVDEAEINIKTSQDTLARRNPNGSPVLIKDMKAAETDIVEEYMATLTRTSRRTTNRLTPTITMTIWATVDGSMV